MKKLLTLAMLVLFCTSAYADQKPSQTSVAIPSIAVKTAGLQKSDGYFPFYWDPKGGKLWLEIDKWNTEFLYIDSLPAGVGSNDIGLDRGRPGDSRVVKFIRVGPKVLLIQQNYSFRALNGSADEQRAVQESFAQSALWGFETAAEDGQRVLVDATPFFLHDIHDIVGTLKQTQQGDYKIDETRSALYLERTKNFPQNTEVEAMLTFVGDSPGQFVKDVVPNPKAITVREHHSLVKLPDDNYKPREYDPRAGYFPVRYMDFSTPIDEPLIRRFIARHRLQKKDPSAAVSEAVKPIVYYIDRSAPEPIRSALLEGASWWNQAFEAAGYKNAFRVEILPAGADPMDVRYNVVEWVHRYTRGWSYGNTVIDPRTGEVIQGHVTLGSQRVRQDFLIAQGLLAPYQAGKTPTDEMQKMALARLRQLAAHEVGHTLGLDHNFIASTRNRASVMDYPHPVINVRQDGSFDLSSAYAVGIGEWDKIAIAYGYQDFPAGTASKPALDNILKAAIDRGIIYIGDQDARPPGSAHPFAHLWDNGADPVAELAHIYDVRNRAIAKFGENNIPASAPMSNLEEVLVPIYLFHRYQVQAVTKMIGGEEYTFAVKGDGQIPTKMVPADVQRKALDSALQSLKPEFLMLPPKLVAIIPPHSLGYPRSRESFNVHTGLPFDPIGAAETAADITISAILQPERAARLVDYHSRDNNLPGLDYVIDKLMDATWKSDHPSGYAGEVQRAVDMVVLYDLMQLAAAESNQSQVRAIAFYKLGQLKDWLSNHDSKDQLETAHEEYAISQISRFLEDPKKMDLTKPVEPPAGAPIGMMDDQD